MQFDTEPRPDRRRSLSWLVAICASLGYALVISSSHDVAASPPDARSWPTFGGGPDRNMVNPFAKDVPTQWQVEEGKLENIKWVAKLGTRSYGGPVVADGRIFVGTNNRQPRDPKVKGAKGVLMCFRASDGKFLWQNAHEMPPPRIVREALHDGLCSTPTVYKGRVYYVTPAAEVVCAMAETGKIVWTYDMMAKLKVVPNYVANCSPLIVDDTIFLVTGNGTDENNKLPSPKAPSFIALSLDGKLLWQSALPGERIIEGQWSNPVYAEVDGIKQVIFPGGDSRLYALDPKTGRLLWQFHCNLKQEEQAAKKRGIPNYIVSTPVVHAGRLYVGVGLYPEHPIGNKVGHFWCIDLRKATKHGKNNPNHDVSIKNDNLDPNSPENRTSALAWHYGGLVSPRPKFGRSVHFGRTISTAAVYMGLVYITEEYGYMHCLDAQTGKKYWQHDFRTGIWGSPMWAEGRVYVGTDDGDVYIFKHGKEKQEVGEPIYMEEPVQATPVFAAGTLYIMTKSKLYAVGAK